jgi:hypothetical protein
MPAPDDWLDGSLTTREALAFLSTSKTAFFAVARAQGWPRRYRGLGTLWPRRVLAAYLDSLPAERGKKPATTAAT